MPGPPPKRSGRRQRTNPRDVGLVPAAVKATPPPVRKEWLKATADAWRQLWASEVAALVKAPHRPALYRLFTFYDRQARCWREAARCLKAAGGEVFVTGSKGQPVLNPLFAAAADAEAEARRIEAKIVALEDRFGLSPMALLKLGVTFEQGRSLAELNRRMVEEHDDDDAYDDPRPPAPPPPRAKRPAR